MDHLHGWALLSFAIGAAAGFQGLYQRYPHSARAAVFTVPAGLYLLSRGALPASFFCSSVVTATRQWAFSPWVWSAIVGASAEIVLRSQYYVMQTGAGAKRRDLTKGPLDLLRWWENMFLTWAGTGACRRRLRLMNRCLPAGTFPQLCHTVRTNLPALSDPTLAAEIDAAMTRLRKEYDAGPKDTDWEEEFRHKLGFLVLDKTNESVFRTLLQPPTNPGLRP